MDYTWTETNQDYLVVLHDKYKKSRGSLKEAECKAAYNATNKLYKAKINDAK